MKNVNKHSIRRQGVPALTYLILFLFLFITSCKKGFYNNKLENKLVVFAEITAEDSIRVSIGKSILVGNGNIISFEKLTNAKVTITPDGETFRSLPVSTSPDFFENPTTVYTHADNIKFNTGYTLNVSQPLFGKASAHTVIPGRFSVSNVNSDENKINDQDVLVFSFVIADLAMEKNYYIFEAVKQLVTVARFFYWQGVRYNYDTEVGKNLFSQVEDQPGVILKKDTIPTNKYIRLPLFKSDNKTANDQIGNLDSSINRLFITDSLFNGQFFSSQFAVSRKRFEANTREERGIVLIQIKSVSKALYDYLSLYEKYKSDFGTIPTGQLSSPQGNIQNGLGVFGGVSKNEWKFYYDDLE